MRSHPAPDPASSGGRFFRTLDRVPAAWLSGCSTLVLLGAVALDGGSRTASGASTADADFSSRAARETVPYCVGDWVGRDVEPAPAVVAMLRPSVLLERSYRNLRTGESATVLFVRCGDARDLMGHYPPVCYPAHGRGLVSARGRGFRAGATEISGMRYRFAAGGTTSPGEIVVDNFMVLPSGRFGRDMDAVDAVARDPRLRRLGAAEVQVVTDAAMTDSRRDEVFESLVASFSPLFERTPAEDGHD
jgi:hypothetical protein